MTIIAEIGEVAKIITGLGTLWLLYCTFKLNKQNQELVKQGHILTVQSKQADMVSEFNSRFCRVWEMRAAPNVKASPVIFYERFWSLQFDQFNAWRNGFVSEDNFQYWFTCRYLDWAKNESFEGLLYKDAFNEVVGKWTHSEFKDFINLLHDKGLDKAILAFPAVSYESLKPN